MKPILEILTSDEMQKYETGWGYHEKYKLNNEFDTHSNIPVIGKIFKFPEKQLFKAHIFGKRLRKYNPYFYMDKYQCFWHLNHYNMAAEQMYHASTSLLRDNLEILAKEYNLETNLRKEAFFRNNISIEMILRTIRKNKDYEMEDVKFYFYDETNKENIGQISAKTMVTERSYIKEYKRLNKNFEQAKKSLIEKINKQDYRLKHLIKPRKDKILDKEILISRILQHEECLEDIKNFFSLWDIPEDYWSRCQPKPSLTTF